MQFLNSVVYPGKNKGVPFFYSILNFCNWSAFPITVKGNHASILVLVLVSLFFSLALKNAQY